MPPHVEVSNSPFVVATTSTMRLSCAGIGPGARGGATRGAAPAAAEEGAIGGWLGALPLVGGEAAARLGSKTERKAVSLPIAMLICSSRAAELKCICCGPGKAERSAEWKLLEGGATLEGACALKRFSFSLAPGALAMVPCRATMEPIP